ncbi:4-hydroxy-tetrahydrodipicolinate synthase [Eubacterium sp. Marseille-QA0814]|jgi:dihydrodipicolinate synthase|uniref:4-hydroxy-tetrahydrodipicolinate synthase n=1 Tax=Eubacterium sp. Marseille-QA0814 TaxID=3378778 RepID=UPI00267142A8|nr:4-hydroxy-tetrahydrodipicolinate synthase [uncultured Eubacterium sp.]
MAIFTGAGVAIITPFNEDDTVNYEEFGRIIDDQIANSTDAIIVCGTTGESSTMPDEEHVSVIKYCVDKVAGRVPVIAGTGSNCTREAVNMSKKAEEVGADGLLCVTPYYNKCTQDGLYEYYKAISDAVNIPIIMYNVPSRTGTTIQPETAVRIAKEVKNVVAIKEASGNISAVAKLASLANGCIDIYSGNDDQVLPILSLGGKGVISVWSHVAPKKVHDMVYAFLDGDIETAQKLQLEAIDVIGALFCEVNPIPVKAAMNMLGYKAGTVRAPLTELTDAHKEVLKKALKDYGVL